jgi:predicted MFS family arabinose efflux permease
VVTFPAFLLGGLAVFLRRDLHFSETRLGALVSVYFAVAAVSSVPVGRAVERFGDRAATSAGVALGALSLAGMSLAPSYPFLLAALAVGGVANALGQLGSNQSLAEAVPPSRRGLAFGVKQSAVPAGTLLASAAVPALGQTVGWRWAFALAAVLALGGLALVPVNAARRPRDRAARTPVALGPLVLIALSATLAAGSANALSTFLIEWGVGSGLGPGNAALILAAGSAVGVVARTGTGWLADRRGRGHLTVVSLQLVGGAVGLLLISIGTAPTLTVGTVIGYGLGWSWPGLLNHALVQLHPGAAAVATSIGQVGVYAGGALGPLGFGLLADTLSFRAAWRIGALAMCLAAAILCAGQWALNSPRRSGAPDP